MRILIIDDNLTSLQSLSVVLTDLGHQPTTFSDPLAALDHAKKSYFPLIITDIKMPEMDGLSLLAELKQCDSSSKSDVIIVTGHGDMDTAITALRNGAYDYLNKPINARELAAAVERSAEHQALLFENTDLKEHFEQRIAEASESLKHDMQAMQSQLRKVTGIGRIISGAPRMQDVIRDAIIFHKEPDVPVLIEGETGTGKEVIARLVHHGETTNDTPFVALNCSAIAESLFESELFGYAAGHILAPAQVDQQGNLNWQQTAHCFWTKLQKCRCISSQNCSAYWKTEPSIALADCKRKLHGSHYWCR